MESGWRSSGNMVLQIPETRDRRRAIFRSRARRPRYARRREYAASRAAGPRPNLWPAKPVQDTSWFLPSVFKTVQVRPVDDVRIPAVQEDIFHDQRRLRSPLDQRLPRVEGAMRRYDDVREFVHVVGSARLLFEHIDDPAR